MSRNFHVCHISLAYLLSEVVLGIAEPDRRTIARSEMPELLERLSQWLRDEQKVELAEELRNAADLIERRPVVAQCAVAPSLQSKAGQ
jgi:hypothetical protein